MSSSVKLFRGLLLASIVTGLLGSMIDQAFTGLIPPTVLKAVKDLPDPPDSTVVLSSLLVLITFGGTMASIVGLFQFKPWSRGLAVSMTLLQLLFYPLGGMWLQSGWAAMLIDFSSTLWGAVLAISYVSSLSKLFASAPVVDR